MLSRIFKIQLSRLLPPKIVNPTFQDVETLIVATYESLLGSDLRFDAILQRRVIFPNRLGGIAMGLGVPAPAAFVASSALAERFAFTSDFPSAALALRKDYLASRANPGSYRVPGYYEDALHEACNTINTAVASISSSTLIEKDPEKKEHCS